MAVTTGIKTATTKTQLQGGEWNKAADERRPGVWSGSTHASEWEVVLAASDRSLELVTYASVPPEVQYSSAWYDMVWNSEYF